MQSLGCLHHPSTTHELRSLLITIAANLLTFRSAQTTLANGGENPHGLVLIILKLWTTRLSDETLLSLIAHSQENALNELYDRYSRLVYSVALNTLSDPGRAEEVTQKVFERVWEKAGTYNAEYGRVVTWLTSYALPAGDTPQMVAIQSGVIWYTEQSLPSIGRLDPTTTDHTIVTVTVHNQTLIPSSTSISPSSSGYVTISNGNLTWRNKTYGSVVDAGGWQIYQMPSTADPWGIVLTANEYVVVSFTVLK